MIDNRWKDIDTIVYTSYTQIHNKQIRDINIDDIQMIDVDTGTDVSYWLYFSG